MTNNQVVWAFINGNSGKSLNMRTDGIKLWSYSTVVAQWIDGKIVKNARKYSVTTSKQLSHLNYDSLTIRKDLPFNTQDLKGQ